jgi:hypothetical protein
VAGRLDPERQTALEHIPDHNDPAGIWPHRLDEGV